VRVKSASINQIDCKLRYGFAQSVLNARVERGNRDLLKGPPFIVGRDFSGEVVQVGEAVPDLPAFQLGQPVRSLIAPSPWLTLAQVLGFVNQLTAQGSWAEYVRVPYWNVAKKPEYLDWNEAASLPFALTGALELLKAYGKG
jgi:NADPH:quinone reductase-like Zn-dependent oxidoreductase